MSDQPTYAREIGLHGPAFIHLEIFLPNAFEITSQERKLVFAMVDAVKEFEAYCASFKAGKPHEH